MCKQGAIFFVAMFSAVLFRINELHLCFALHHSLKPCPWANGQANEAAHFKQTEVAFLMRS